MPSALIHFQHLRPDHEIDQEETLEWVAHAHAEAETLKQGWSKESSDYQELLEKVRARLLKIGLGKDRIRKRGTQIEDFLHRDWEQMEIYNVGKDPQGMGFGERTLVFERSVSHLFERFYPEGSSLPPHLIHVTCTGYVSPSGAQKLVSKRGYGSKTMVTHAYHMGCYAALPALRIGRGFLKTTDSPAQVDIVHTEMCSLHLNPLLHDMEQLLIHSLFADGFIKYSLLSEESAKKQSFPYFKILGIHEEILPNSIESMAWKCDDWGLRMSLAKEVPVLIAKALPSFLSALAKQTDFSSEHLQSTAHFAIHPGGPKILDQAEKILNLTPDQLEVSRTVLKEFGNMSSATLPHIWEKILQDPTVAQGALILSLAVGPGLSLCGGILEKCVP